MVKEIEKKIFFEIFIFEEHDFIRKGNLKGRDIKIKSKSPFF